MTAAFDDLAFSNRPDIAAPVEALPGRDALLRLIVERRSVRAFSGQPVDRAFVEAILDVGRWAPSGANIQPWEVHVLSGKTKERFTELLLQQRAARAPERPDYQYYPVEWHEPYKSRRMALGVSMYRAYGAAKGRKSREESWNRNYVFFDAPVGLLFFIRRDLATGSWVDYGMFIQNVILAARAYGLETCPQASLSEYPDVARELLGIGPDHLFVCGISLGHPDWTQPVNGFARVRIDVAEFTTFHD